MEAKKCSRCGEKKSLDNYAYKCKPKRIKKPHCKECDKRERRQYYVDNKNKVINTVLKRNKLIHIRNGTYIWNYLSKHPCIDCNESNPIVLEFDHKDGEIKTKAISRMVGEGSSIEDIEKEIKKCDIRCANCHKIKTAKQFNWYSYIKDTKK